MPFCRHSLQWPLAVVLALLASCMPQLRLGLTDDARFRQAISSPLRFNPPNGIIISRPEIDNIIALAGPMHSNFIVVEGGNR